MDGHRDLMEEPESFENAPILEDDVEAEQCIRTIKFWERERDKMVDHYKRQIEVVTEKANQKISYQQYLLNNYFNRIPHRETKTQECYDLPSGKLVMRKEHDALRKPTKEEEQGILLRLAEEGVRSFTKIKESLDWDNYRKQLSIVDGKVVDKTTGECIDDVAIEHVEAKFAVRMNDDEEENQNGTVSAS